MLWEFRQIAVLFIFITIKVYSWENLGTDQSVVLVVRHCVTKGVNVMALVDLTSYFTIISPRRWTTTHLTI